MIQRLLNRLSLSRIFSILVLSLLLPSTVWAEDTEPPITVAGIEPNSDGVFINEDTNQPISGVKYENGTLTLTEANIEGDIISNAEALTINLVRGNTLNGKVLLNNDMFTEGSLSFSGDGSLTINDEYSAITDFTEVNLNGFKIASNSFGVYWSNNNKEYWGSDGCVSKMTITKDVYPIWVYTGEGSTGYTQLTEENPSVTIMQNGSSAGSVSYSNSKLTLNNCNYSTVDDNNAFYIGEGINSLNVYLEGNNTINGSGFSFPFTNNEYTAALYFTTNNTTPGSLTINGSSFTDRDVKVHCENPLGYEDKKVSTNWTRLRIGNTLIAETTTNPGGLEGVSFNTSTNTLTLSGAAIEGNIISNIEALTINFQGTNTINGSLYMNNQIEGTLSFTGSNDATLTLDNSGSGSVIYNFTSVDFGGFNLATTSSPGIFYIVDEPNGNPNQLWSNNIMGYASNVTLTKKTIYPLWIGTYTSSSYQTLTQVTEDNYTDILGNGKISFDKNHTLTLSGATITGSIISGLSSLNIVIDNDNSIQIVEDSATCIRSIDLGATLTLQKKQNSETASLTVQGGSLIRDFKSISYSEGGLNLSAYNRTYQESNPVDVIISDAYYTNNGFQTSSPNSISYVKFSTENPFYLVMIGNTPITATPTTINASGNEEDDIRVGSVTLSVDANNNNILTIDNLQTGGKDIVSTLPNLTIKYKGTCQIGEIISNYSNAALTFGLAEGASNEDKCNLSHSGNVLPWKGFASNPTFNDKLIYIPGTNSHYIKKLKSPEISIEEGIYLTSEDQFEYAGNDAISFYYTIDYVDESKVDVSTPQKYEGFTPDHPFTISAPAILSVYAHYSYQGMEQNSENTIGKYFGFASNTVETTYSEDVNLPTISPTLPEGVRPYYNVQEGGNTAGVTFNEETGTITGYSNVGEATVNVELRYDEYPNFTILNERENDFENLGNFTLTIVPKSLTNDMIQAIADQTYAGIALTPDVKVKDGEKTLTLGTEYEVSYKQGESAVSSPTSAGSYSVVVTGKGNYTDTATKTFTIAAKDLATATITLDSEQTYTYTGSAIEPNISSVSIKLTEDAEPATNLTAETDYTVSYTNNINAATAESDNAPTVTITGKGNYSGTKDVYFTINKGSAGLQFYRMNGDQVSPVNTIQSATYGEAFDTPLLANPHELSITYSSKASNSLEAANSDVVTIDSEGNLTIGKIGRAYIFATTAGEGNYEGGTVSYVLDVNPANLANVTIAEIADTTYNGLEIKPEINVTLNGKTVSTDDYTISYSNNINVSTDTNKATITLTAKSTSEHFTEGTTKTATFNIVAKSITNDMILAIADQNYSFGSAITPAITVKDGETTLTLATTADDTGDYSVAYSNNTNAAKSTDDVAPTVTITGKGNYTGTASKTFTINPMEVATATISLSDAPLTYNGTAQHPTISSIVVENGDGSTLEFSSSDYTVSYKQNENTITADNIINVGEYILIASFGGNYSGTATKTFNIAARDLSDAAIIAPIPDQTYTGNEIKPEPEVSIVLINGTDATTLTKDIDFEFSYANNIAAANSTDTNAPTVTITGKGNYTGSASANFTINNATMAMPAEGYSNTYDGKAHGITVTKPEGATVMYGTKKGTYNLEESPTYTNAGSYWVHYQATQANYSTVADSALVEITARSLADATIGEITAITYTGNEIEPTPTVSIMLTEGATEATVLVAGTDFTYSYKNNTNVPAEDATSENLPTVTITGKGNYTGSTSTTFTINKAAATISKTPTANTLTFNGEQQELITTGECSGGTMQYKLSTDETWSTNVPKASAQGTYIVMYQVAGDQNHTSIEASDETKIEVTIAASNITNATVTLSKTSFTYNGTEQKPTVTSVSIPATEGDTGSNPITLSESDYEVSSYSEGCTNIGTYTVTVTLKGNYSGTAKANFIITERSLADAIIGEITAITYTGNEIEPTPTVSVMLTEGATEATVLRVNTDFTYSYKNNTNVPAEGATSENLPTVTIKGKGNYTGSTLAIFTINKAAATITKVPTANTLTFNGEQQELITAGECSGGTMQYKLSNDETWSTNVPKAKDAGKYTVDYMITGDQNHLDSEAESIVVTINDRTIDPAEDIEFNEGQSYASFYSADEDLALPEEGIAVFMITGLDGNTLTTQAVTYIPKGVPVLVMKASGTTQTIDPSEVSNNMLHYATSDVTADGTTYILYNGEYVKATGTIPAGKCYLKLNKPSEARALAIGNGTTGIDRLDNTIWATDNWFDLNGRRIEKPTKKGLYIKNGKKVVVK